MTLKVKLSPSASDPVSAMSSVLSSSTAALIVFATGGSLTLVMEPVPGKITADKVLAGVNVGKDIHGPSHVIVYQYN